MVEMMLPGERWEVEFFDDRDSEVELFVIDGTLHGPEKLVDIAQKARPGVRPLQTFETGDYNSLWASREAATAARCG